MQKGVSCLKGAWGEGGLVCVEHQIYTVVSTVTLPSERIRNALLIFQRDFSFPHHPVKHNDLNACHLCILRCHFNKGFPYFRLNRHLMAA